jgi:nucleoid DNA-binding protein
VAKPAKSASKTKSAAKPQIKPIKEKLGKSDLARHLSDQSGVEPKSVKAVLSAFEGTLLGVVHKNGSREFTLPGMFKVSAIAVAAKPKRKGKDPFTGEERWFAAKPASVKIKVRALKKLKDAAL